MKHSIRLTAVLLLFAMLLVTAAQAAPMYGSSAEMTVSEASHEAAAELVASLLEASEEKLDINYNEPDEDELVRVIVQLEEAPLVEKGIYDPTAANARKGAGDYKAARNDLVKRIEKEVFDGESLKVLYTYSFLLNGFSMEVPYGTVEKIAAVEGVRDVSVAPTFVALETVDSVREYSVPETLADDEIRENPTEYRGEHTAIAILDTGIEYDHPAFKADVKNPLITKSELAKKLDTLDFNSVSIANVTVDDLYHSVKIPYSFDYGDMDADATCPHDDPHGIHVAGIAAGDDTLDSRMDSAAPDAQLVPIKIFNSFKMSTLDMLAAAMEDCMLLGVDSLNMSFALVEAFSSMESLAPFSTACQNAIEAGMNVVAACGNSFNSSLLNKIGGKSYAWSPDNSITTSPATLINVIGVAADSGKTRRVVQSFSSQGPNADLVLSPEVSCYGLDVVSSYIDGSFARESGTSMASPYVAGGIAAIRQYIRAKVNLNSLPTKMDIQELAKSLMICTAIPTTGQTNSRVLASPRKQGAGHMNMEGAVKTPAYITIGENTRPIIDQIDDVEKTGVYDLEFRVNNMTKNDIGYTVEVITMTEDSLNYIGPDGAPGSYMAGYTKYLEPKVSVSNLTNNTLSVKGSAYQDVKVTVTLSETDRTYLEEKFVNGGYVEGFILLHPTDDNGVDLTVPFLCFYGDWTKAPMIDVTDYGDIINEEPDWSSTIVNSIYVKAHSRTLLLGDNPVHPGEVPYNEERNAISPNGDNDHDRIERVEVGLLRSAKRAGYKIWNENGVYWTREKEYVNKTYTSMFDRTVQNLSVKVGFTPWRGSDLPNDTKVYLTTFAYADFDLHEINNDFDEWTVPVTIDTESPHLIQAKLRTEGSKTYLDLIARDNQFIADITISDSMYNEVYESRAIAENQRNSQRLYTFDVTGRGNDFGVTIIDYAMNFSAFDVRSGSYNDPFETPDPNVRPGGEDILPGDANLDGVLTAGDATMILRHVVDLVQLTGDNLIAADTNGDGLVTAGDATMVLRKVVGLG